MRCSHARRAQYGATWALVTGASSGASAMCAASAQGVSSRDAARCCCLYRGAGIGKSLAQKLALQGLNVVLVALDVRAPRCWRTAQPALVCTLRSVCARLTRRLAPPQEPLLNDTTAELQAAFPKLKFLKARPTRDARSAGSARTHMRCKHRLASTWARRARI